MATQIGPRRPSVGELEELPSVWAAGNPSLLLRIHEFIYPKSQWFWYRRGKVSHTTLGPKFFKLMLGMFIMAFCTSGFFFPMILIAFSAYLRTMHGIGSNGVLDVSLDNLNHTEIAQGDVAWRNLASQPWFIILQCLLSGIVTMGAYEWNGEYLIRTFYTDRKEVPDEWKCQPNRYLSPDRWREEKILGSINAFVAGVYGTGLYFLHLNRPFLKLYYDASPMGFGKMFFSMVICYLWIGEFGAI